MAKKGGEENEEKTELLVFGYACKLFRDDERALMIDNETHLIPWMGDESLKIDRYDGRGALYDLASHESQPGSWDHLSPEELEIEECCDSERYRSLFMNEVEEITYKEEQVKRQQQDYGQIAYDYDAQMSVDSADQPEAPSKPFVPPPDMVLPPDLKVPETMKHSAIIERTALFIAQQGSQMEILMKLKQQGNKNFDFLSHNDPLHEFYKHVLSLIKSGSYVPTSQEQFFDENPVDVSTEDDSDGHYLHPSLVTTLNPKNAPPPPTTVPSGDKSAQSSNEPPPLVQKVIEKMISYVIRNGPAFERAIMRKDDERFNFIRTKHKYYAFYRSSLMKRQKIYNEELLQKLQKQKAAEEKVQQQSVTEDHETKTFKKRPLPVNFSIKKPKESKGLEVPSALPVEESSDEEEEASSPKQASAQGSYKTESHSGETSDDPEYINPLSKRLKKSTETTKKHKQKKDAELQTERKLKVAQFIKDLKKKSS